MKDTTTRISLFERAVMRLDAEAAGEHAPFTPRASGDVEDSDIGAELGQRSTRLLESVAEAVSRDIGGVTAGDKGRAKARPITAEEVQGWFEQFSQPHPSLEDCAELADGMTKLAWPEPVAWPSHPDGLEELPWSTWNFDGVPKAAQILLANLPIMLSPCTVPAIPPGDAEGRAALIELQAALNRATPYLGNPYSGPQNHGYRLKSWHLPAIILCAPVYGALVRAGHIAPGITRNSIVVGVLRSALLRMGHKGHSDTPLTKGAIGQHLTRWLAASGMTTNDLAAFVTKTQAMPSR